MSPFEINQNTQEVKRERFLIRTRQNKMRISGKLCLRQSDERTNRYKTRNVVNTYSSMSLLKQFQCWSVLKMALSPPFRVDRPPLPFCTPLSSWAGLHDNVPADLLPRGQTVRQSRVVQPRCTDVPDWVTTSAVQSTC